MEQKGIDIRWWLFLFFFVCAIIIFAFFSGVRYERRKTGEVQRDTVIVVRRDTIKLVEPAYIVEKRIDTLFVPIKDTIRINDTLFQPVQRTQKEYKDSLYRAWVSGYKPTLDSIHIFQNTKTVTITEITRIPPPKWGVGVIGGYGVGKNGFSPYVGIGVYYNLFRKK